MEQTFSSVVAHLVENLSAFITKEGLLLQSEEPVVGHKPISDEHTSHPHNFFPYAPF
jgi:hypothetical protein